MTLSYKILWIEDTPKAVRAKKRIIKHYLENEKGYTCEIKEIDNFNSFEQDIGYVKTSNYDLLLVDLDLGSEDEHHNGNDIIKRIRDENIYTEIIFYSSQYENLMSIITNPFIEGIFTSERDMLDTKVKKIIDVTIKKVQDVNNLRGLIMAEVAELDLIKEEIIQKASEKVPSKSLERYTLKKIKSSGQSSKSQAERHIENISEVTFNSLFQKIGFIDSNKKAMAIGEALDKLNITEPVTKATFTQPYIDNILDKRNKFAHIKECEREDDNGNKCWFIGDIPFTEEKCIEIRKEIREYRKILEDIKTAV